MKIDQTSGSVTPARLPAKAHEAAARPAPEANAPEQQGLASNIREFPDLTDGTFNAAKVQQIREEIRTGQYKMDPERIADGILGSLRDLIPLQK